MQTSVLFLYNLSNLMQNKCVTHHEYTIIEGRDTLFFQIIFKCGLFGLTSFTPVENYLDCLFVSLSYYLNICGRHLIREIHHEFGELFHIYHVSVS